MKRSKAGNDYIGVGIYQEHIGCAVIVKDDNGRILLGKRKNAYKSGMYGLPGGRIDRNEKARDTAIRELLEETGLKAKSITYVGVIKEWQNGYNFIHFIYLCTEWAGDVRLVEPDKCAGWEWFSVDELPQDTLSGHLQGIKLMNSKEEMKDI